MTPPRCLLLSLPWLALCLCQCAKDKIHTIAISVPDQRMAVYKKGELIREYRVSTSKFALSDQPGSKGTPLGHMEIAKKFGGGLPPGAVLKDRKWTGEILPPDAPGRDPIVSRILWLRGLEPQNANAYNRYIYIHGTAEESRLGSAASYGCIRMASRDVVELFDIVGVGAGVDVRNEPLRRVSPGPTPVAWVSPVSPLNQSVEAPRIMPPHSEASAVLPVRIPPPPLPTSSEMVWLPPGPPGSYAMTP